jgi:hypothetical protein
MEGSLSEFAMLGKILVPTIAKWLVDGLYPGMASSCLRKLYARSPHLPRMWVLFGSMDFFLLFGSIDSIGSKEIDNFRVFFIIWFYRL